jgi:uncharacterized protein DUF1761
MTILQHCWWQVLVAAIAYFALGAVWFNPKVFGTLWMQSHGINISEEDKKKVNMGRLMGLSFICTVLMTAVICYVCCMSCCVGDACIPGSSSLGHCLKIGFMLGFGTASASISMAYLYQMKPRNAYLTDCGYHIVGSMIAAAVLHFLGCC